MAARVILVGVGGFGTHFHLPNIRRLRELGIVTPIALVDPIIKAQAVSSNVAIPQDAPLFDTLSEALAHVGVPDIVIVSVPIHLHAPITKEALRAGADVLLEKPPFACFQDFQEVLDLQEETGRVVQIGFQSLGSLAIAAIRDERCMDLGEIRSVRAIGTWLRRKAYWNRSHWVGKRHLGEVDVMDGVATNALAHAVITALHIAGIKRADQVKSVEVEAYRANPIDTDDTTSIRVTPHSGPPVIAGLTLCASVQTKPTVDIACANGVATYEYTTDDLISASGATHFERVDMLQNLVDHRTNQTRLILPLVDTGAFMMVMEALRTGPAPVHIERKWIDQRESEGDIHAVVRDVEHWIRTATSADSLFSEVGAPWAFNGRDSILMTAVLEGQTIFAILDGAGTTPSSSPRPYIHPVRTLGGIVVSDTHPADHDWHCGVGFAVPDVNGTSFWGGGTFIKGRDYVMLDNHGVIRHDGLAKGDGKDGEELEQMLAWVDRDGRDVISEKRRMAWQSIGNASSATGWILSFRTTLQATEEPMSLGSPGTNGRPGGGYGGFFWRLPRCSAVTIMSAEADGEDAIHGSISPWIAWTARFEGSIDSVGDATLVFVPDDEHSARDPWIVRCAGYPGVGSAVAWEDRVEVLPSAPLSRSFRIAVLDGRLDRQECAVVAGAIQYSRV